MWAISYTVQMPRSVDEKQEVNILIYKELPKHEIYHSSIDYVPLNLHIEVAKPRIAGTY